MITFKNVTGLDKKFSLREITFQLEFGYILGITGKNGVGKSTLLKYIVEPETKYTGEILINGRKITNEIRDYMNEVAYIAEEPMFEMHWTGKENARLYETIYENWNMEVFEHYMKQFELSLYRNIEYLSRGEYIRFQLALAMAHDAKILLFDEITAGMDPIFRREFFQLLGRLLESGERSVIMTTQLKEELEERADYVAVLKEGRMTSFEEVV